MSTGEKAEPWTLSTPPGSSQYTMYRDEQADPPAAEFPAHQVDRRDG